MAYIKFAEKDQAQGLFWLAIRSPLTCFRGGMIEVPGILLDKLQEAGFEYEIVPWDEARKVRAAVYGRDHHEVDA
jgi:hypothetical protein